MEWLRQLFCKHKFKIIAKRKSDYTSDHQTFSDYGWYDDVLYRCEKCGKEEIITRRNKNHVLYNPWRYE